MARSKSKAKTAFVCAECGAEHRQWQGQCASCQVWNSLKEISIGPVPEVPRAGGYAGAGAEVKRLGEETLQVTRRTRVLEERVLPGLRAQVRQISQYIGEREREAYFRLKKFKDASARRTPRSRPT